MNHTRIPSQGLALVKSTHWSAAGLHWVGMGSCTDTVIVLPDNVTHIGYKEERVFESDCYDTQHIRSGWRSYYVPAPLILPSSVEEIHISASVKDISKEAFSRLSHKVRLFVDEANPYYEVSTDNKIVSKKKP